MKAGSLIKGRGLGGFGPYVFLCVGRKPEWNLCLHVRNGGMFVRSSNSSQVITKGSSEK